MSTADYSLSEPFILHLGPVMRRLSGDEFFDVCRRNPDLKLECTAEGDLIVMTPPGGETGEFNSEISGDLVAWNRIKRTGHTFDSSTLFDLPNGARRAPDAAWVINERWDALTRAERQRVVPLAPDFVIEIRSPSDRLTTLRAKIREYVDNGVRLGWLIDPEARTVAIYRPGEEPRMLENPATVEGDPELPGFVLRLGTLWPE